MAKRRRHVGRKKSKGKVKIHPSHEMGKKMGKNKRSRRKRG